MTFPNVGTTIHSMLKMTQLNMKWQERKKDPTKPKDNEPPESPAQRQLRDLKKMAEDARKTNYVESLKTKLKCGGDLTAAELDYLKANHPELYEDAVETRQDREQYKRELENCRTQEEVDRLNINRMNGYVAQAKSVSANPNIPLEKKVRILEKITAKVMGVKADFNKFVKAGHYDSLPSEEETDEKKKTKRKATPPEEPQEPMPIADNAKAEIEKELAALTSSENEPPASGDAKAEAAPAPGDGTVTSSEAAPAARGSGTASTPAGSPAAVAPTGVSGAAPAAAPAGKQGGFSIRV